MFLAFEGIDGSGKTTQAALLAKHLGRQGREVVLVREPGATPLGEELRQVLLRVRTDDLAPEAELMLFMAARAELVRARIRPSLERGAVVISDRSVWSSVAYQGVAGGIGIESVLEVGRVATRGLEPDLTFVLDVEPAAAHGTLDSGDRLEGRGPEFQERIRAAFLALISRFPGKLVLIDGRGAVEEVHARILRKVPAVRRDGPHVP